MVGRVDENLQAITLNPARAVPTGKGYYLVGEFKITNQKAGGRPAYTFGGTYVDICSSDAVHDGGSEGNALVNASGGELTEEFHVKDAEYF